MIERAGFLDPAIEQRRRFHTQLVKGTDKREYHDSSSDLERFFHIEDNGVLRAPPKPILMWGVQHIQHYFELADGVSRPMVERKILHTKHVMEHIYHIAKSSGETKILQELLSIGFLHDMFRFPQAVLYKTFKDGESFDHADMAAECIARAHLPFVKVGLSEIDCLNAIAEHSQLKTPKDKKSLYIRDADKLVIMEEFMQDNARLLEKGISMQDIDDESLEQLLQGKVIKHNAASFLPVNRTLQRISWMHDLHFRASQEIVSEKKVFERLFGQLQCFTNDFRLADVERHILSHSFNGMYSEELQPVL